MLVMAAAKFVPILGDLGIAGYSYEWARLVAWNVDAAPKQKGVKVGTCLSSGLRATVIEVCWSLLLFVAYSLLTWLLGYIPVYNRSGIQAVLDLVFAICMILVSVVGTAAAVRATVYEKLGTGFRFDRIFDMVRADFGGLCRMIGIELLGGVIYAAISLVFFIASAGFMLPSLIELFEYLFGNSSYYGYGLANSYPLAIQGVINSVTGLIPVLVVMTFILNVVSVIFTMLVNNGVALWMRQFDVPAWGKSSDPLPASSVPPEKPVSPAGVPAGDSADAAQQPGQMSQQVAQQPAQQVAQQLPQQPAQQVAQQPAQSAPSAYDQAAIAPEAPFQVSDYASANTNFSPAAPQTPASPLAETPQTPSVTAAEPSITTAEPSAEPLAVQAPDATTNTQAQETITNPATQGTTTSWSEAPTTVLPREASSAESSSGDSDFASPQNPSEKN